MSNSPLHIKDALRRVSSGMLIASSDTTKLDAALGALIGTDAATRLLQQTGRAGILHLDENELVASTGIAPHLAERLVAARRLFNACRTFVPSVAGNAERILETLPVDLGTLEIEVLLAVALDAQLRPAGTVFLAQGGPSSAVIIPRYVFTPLVRLNARAFVLVHNHPSGVATPSREDITLTNAIAKLGYLLDLPLVDHLIVAGTEVCSFAELELLPSQEELTHLA